MQVNAQKGVELLNQNTGIDMTRQAKSADRYLATDNKAESRMKTDLQTKSETVTTSTVRPGITFGEPRPDRGIEFESPINLEDLFNPGSRVGDDDQKAGDADGTEPTSVFGDVNLNDLNSIEDAISKIQDQIADGDANGQTFQDLQLLLNAQLQQISLQSNMQKALHDAQMAVINNIR